MTRYKVKIIFQMLLLGVFFSTQCWAKNTKQNSTYPFEHNIIKTNSHLKSGQAFLSRYKKKRGVKTLSSGIAYKVLKKGKGKTSPKRYQRVTTHYQGKLINNTVFDSSYVRQKPIQFDLTNVISGWSEVLQYMVVGDKWEVVIPSHLAYGQRPVGPIPANSTLIFIIELLEID